MIRKGSVMKLYPGMEKEYEKRHAELWPEIKEAIYRDGAARAAAIAEDTMNVVRDKLGFVRK
jgi:L-rhamnose mutarotase